MEIRLDWVEREGSEETETTWVLWHPPQPFCWTLALDADAEGAPPTTHTVEILEPSISAHTSLANCVLLCLNSHMLFPLPAPIFCLQDMGPMWNTRSPPRTVQCWGTTYAPHSLTSSSSISFCPPSSSLHLISPTALEVAAHGQKRGSSDLLYAPPTHLGVPNLLAKVLEIHIMVLDHGREWAASPGARVACEAYRRKGTARGVPGREVCPLRTQPPLKH